MASRGRAETVVHFPTTHQRVVDELGQRIVGGAWAPGDPLPVEDVLAAGIGVSRGILREAVKALVAKGMLRVRPRTGTRVLPPEHWNHLDRDVLRWKQARDATALLRDTGELRRIVEPEAARLAAHRAGPDDVRVLYDSLAAMEAAAAAPGRSGYVEADIAFHRALLDASGNRLLGSLGRAVDIALEHSFVVSTRTPGAVEASLPRHRAVVQAVEAGDPVAAAAAVLSVIEAAEREIAQSPVSPGDARDGTV
ncbi:MULTISPECIES: FadR/GntR family transcriptional regulator [Streptomyces]|uniref:FadR/GntR family transcriptional regulator n=1 Tax=Streptomyces TaxID=1883 RepID=UPI001CCC1DD5|nr:MULTISPECIES: FadR/GntR family transcriptional regulator [Streptomyces]MBZ6141805.1 FadR family transcriptional regulator [Streptomyces olivaceus]MBZ6169527.1 FadR family transcriptional regulator [Streptomyces olivaceus]MBZ6176959.1 FadR family transcriptional regulator [Streptomyces olivaceus]MBZ6183218.1 FadR family transcriptional regulator [Streptomyces olivaceus]MCM8553814.1 FadR family transcriptional regulator [Streptomyces sp. STCH 565 A]